ncbi:stress protein, member of the CspA-family [Legionella wadsworthii]|uniref:Stress protein, member of the CspA-family n=1 Tax=Legionella wadsworthii TaxID=28088 RepID=A0A378LT52_9GAMM|nr:cold shock domain-containing protein [Legionella wadsworthii]STY29520.1 stress protein, member of the CspA-family [Legionella wadsworthii]
MEDLVEGTVKWFNTQKGYGFIISNEVEYFVHYKFIKVSGFKNLTIGDKVSFIKIKNEKGYQAHEVRLLN